MSLGEMFRFNGTMEELIDENKRLLDIAEANYKKAMDHYANYDALRRAISQEVDKDTHQRILERQMKTMMASSCASGPWIGDDEDTPVVGPRGITAKTCDDCDCDGAECQLLGDCGHHKQSKECKPSKNNDGNKTCVACGAATKRIDAGVKYYDICTNPCCRMFEK